MSERVPVRRCVACRNRLEKTELFRVVNVNDSIVTDPTQKLNGRGAYLCRNKDCIMTAQKRHSLERALGTDQIGDVYSILISEV